MKSKKRWDHKYSSTPTYRGGGRITRRRRFDVGGTVKGYGHVSCPPGQCQTAAGDCYSCPDSPYDPPPGPGSSNPPGTPGSGGCFQAGTTIETSEGVKLIENIKVGDIIKSFNTKTNTINKSKVTETFVHENNSDLLIINKIIKTTTNHPFYTESGDWVEAVNLRLNDKILHVDGEYHKVKSLKQLNYSDTVYNFEVENDHTYFAEGYLVHNKITYTPPSAPAKPPKPKSVNPGIGHGWTPDPGYEIRGGHDGWTDEEYHRITGGGFKKENSYDLMMQCRCNDEQCSSSCSNDGSYCTGPHNCHSGGGGGSDSGGNGGGDHCFQEGTNINIPKGLEVIENIKVGDTVKSYDVENNKVVESIVTETFEHSNSTNGLLLNEIIKTTKNHPFYTENGDWVEAINLKLGDKILHVDGEYHEIISMKLFTDNLTVYNFEVDKTHNYFAEGYLVHNKFSYTPPSAPSGPPKPKRAGGIIKSRYTRGGRIARKRFKKGGRGGGSRNCTMYNNDPRSCNMSNSCSYCRGQCRPTNECIGNVKPPPDYHWNDPGIMARGGRVRGRKRFQKGGLLGKGESPDPKF